MQNEVGSTMAAEPGFFAKLYRNYRLVALFPAVAVIVDYALTFFLAGDTSLIISWEASPFVRYAVIHNLMVPYLVAIVLFYAGASYAVLRILDNTVYYRFGFILIVTMSVTHLIGGMSWYFRNSLYSDGVLIMSVLSIVIAFVAFGFSLLREWGPEEPPAIRE
jgi:hypothetical protein